MTIKLTDNQIDKILSSLTKDQLIDYLAEDIERSVDWISEFIWNYVDSETLQRKLKRNFPPIQMELFND